MIGNNYFYNESIKNLAATFGFLFKDITISRARKDGTAVPIRVPLHYGDQSKVFMYNQSGNNPFNSVWPRMAFDFNIAGVDETRKTSRDLVFKMGAKQNIPGIWSMRNAIPYNFSFRLFIGANDIQDGLQILEQILPFFQPELTVKIKPLKDFPEFIIDVPIELMDVTHEFESDGEIEDKDYYNWTLEFNVRGWLFSPINNDTFPVIDVATINLKDFGMMSHDISVATANTKFTSI